MTPRDTADVTIIGSGPAGVSAAWPLVEAGLSVEMIDAGLTADGPMPFPERSFADWRRVAGQWQVFLGTDGAALGRSSPKLRAPLFRHVFQDFARRTGIDAEGFTANGSLAAGGLSGAWGAGVGAFTEEELADYPIARSDLLPSYGAIAARIGVHGSLDDDLAPWFGTEYPVQAAPEIHPLSGQLLDRYRRGGTAPEFRLGRLRMAVITESMAGRLACDRAMMCIYGCSRRAVYDAAFELPALRARPNFTYRPGWFVDRIRRGGDGFLVEASALTGEGRRSFPVRRLVLAAGTLGSTRLVLDLLGAYDRPVPLATAPTMSFALFVPGHVGTPPAERSFAHANLALTLTLPTLPGRPTLFGSILPTDGMLPSELAGRLPVLKPFGRWLAARLWPHMLVGACFFPGAFAASTLTLRRPERPDGGGRLTIRGGYKPELTAAVALARRRIAVNFWKLGALLLPASTVLARPGEDMHYAATLPMTGAPGPLETDRDGCPAGLTGLHVVDGSVLTSLPARSHTFTIMANADRIARKLAERCRMEAAVAG